MHQLVKGRTFNCHHPHWLTAWLIKLCESYYKTTKHCLELNHLLNCLVISHNNSQRIFSNLPLIVRRTTQRALIILSPPYLLCPKKGTFLILLHLLFPPQLSCLFAIHTFPRLFISHPWIWSKKTACLPFCPHSTYYHRPCFGIALRRMSYSLSSEQPP